MVWALSCRSTGGTSPRTELVNGDDVHLILEVSTPDGGTGVTNVRGGGQSFSGRHVKPESVPKAIRWLSKRTPDDYVTAWVKTVSDRFRALIEEIEPGVHQFEPVKFVAKDGSPLADRWFWQICNRIDSVHREKTNWTLPSFSWRAPKNCPPLLVFDLARVRTAHFWHDKHMSASSYVSDEAKARIEAADITGVYFNHYDQA